MITQLYLNLHYLVHFCKIIKYHQYIISLRWKTGISTAGDLNALRWKPMGQMNNKWIVATDSTMNCESLGTTICPISQSYHKRYQCQVCWYFVSKMTHKTIFVNVCNTFLCNTGNNSKFLLEWVLKTTSECDLFTALLPSDAVTNKATSGNKCGPD